MPMATQSLLDMYIHEVKKIYKSHVRNIILFGSYARGDFRPDSDIDIMILLDLDNDEIKELSQSLSDMTYDFNIDNDSDIKPLLQNQAFFQKWIPNYPFYSEIAKEGVSLYAA